MRYTHQGSKGPRKSRIRYLPPDPRRAVVGPLLVGGQNGDGPFRKRGGRCGIPNGAHRGPEIAHPLSIAPSNAGGRWLTLGGWPKWRRVVLEIGAADAV